MTRSSIYSVVAALVVASCVLASAPRASAGGNVSRGGKYSFRLESNGRVLPTHHYRGRTYVEGQRGDRYSIRVQNHSSERIEAVVTVDGRDVITGRPGNYRSQRGYVIRPWGSVTIDGFRRSWSGVAAFRFTEIHDSYAARMGDASNVGVIGVAVFRERTYQPQPRPPIAYGKRKSGVGTGYGAGGSASEAPAAQPSPYYDADEVARERRSQGIGTGYGEDQYSPATETQFERRNSRRPDARLKLYYDDREGLIARGVIPRPYYPPPPPPYYPDPYPDPYPYYDPGFAPPPPPYYWE